MHPDLDSKPSKNPFDRFPVVAYRIESGTHVEERFFVAFATAFLPSSHQVYILARTQHPENPATRVL